MDNPNKKNWGLMAAVGAGIAASACCTIPLLLVAMGAGGAWVSTFTAFEPFRLDTGNTERVPGLNAIAR